jgi:hypothetical protein
MNEEPVERIVFENADFKFKAAYEVYASKFEESQGSEERQRLNELISMLEAEEISYPRFYNEVKDDGGPGDRRHRFYRTSVKGSRKFAYRRAQQKKRRIERHKK